MRWFFLFIWIELILVFSLGCTSPKDRRGDWMEDLSGREYQPIDWSRRRSPWYRNYKDTEEIHADWDRVYRDTMLRLDKIIEENTP